MVDLRLVIPSVLGLVASLTIAIPTPRSEPTATFLLQTPTPTSFRFLPQVFVAPRPGPPMVPQDVQGRVLDRDGKGVTGLTVRAQSDGWSASTATGEGGSFAFNLTQGVFTVILPGQNSPSARAVVDGSTQITILFRATANPEPAGIATPSLDAAADFSPRVEVTVVVLSTPLAASRGSASAQVSGDNRKESGPGFQQFGLLVAGAGISGAALVATAIFLMNRRRGL